MSEPVALLPASGMGIYEICPRLYQCGGPESSDDWDLVFRLADVVVSLGSSDEDTKPDIPSGRMLIRWNITDGPLPDLERLDGLTELLARWVGDGTSVLVHCGAGLNRSGLVTAMTLRRLTGQDGRACAALVRERRPEALFNRVFNGYLDALLELEQEEFPELEQEESHAGEPTEADNAGGSGGAEEGGGG